MIKALLTWGPAAVWAVVLFLLSAGPGLASAPRFAHADKVAHFGLYAILGAALAYGRTRAHRPIRHSLLIGMGLLYGGTDELHQRIVPGRHADFADWLADAAGVIVGYALMGWMTARATSLRRERTEG